VVMRQCAAQEPLEISCSERPALFQNTTII
jgi:hypothetical protein